MLKFLRRIRRKLADRPRSSYKEACLLIEKASLVEQYGCRREKGRLIDSLNGCVLMPASSNDGVGIQAMIRICLIFLARKGEGTYIHVPFIGVGHQKIDPIGRDLSREEWASLMEGFLNLGQDEVWITDLADSMGKRSLARHLETRSISLVDPVDERENELAATVNSIRDIRFENPASHRVWSLGLEVCRFPVECEMHLDESFIKVLRSKFRKNGYVPKTNFYEKKYLDVAIHIRRGDVWRACKSGSTKRSHTNKLMSQEYYVDLLSDLQSLFSDSVPPVRFHVFSDGKPEDFDDFVFGSEEVASLKLESGLSIENIQFHLCDSTIDSLYHLIEAPILVPGKSTFSVLAILLGESVVLYDERITEFYQYDLLAKYMSGNSRFVSLDGTTEEILVSVREAESLHARF